MTHFYYQVIEGSRNLLSDERNKKHLLDLLFSMLQQQNWPVYAFCVTDDNAYIITEVSETEAFKREAGSVIQVFFSCCEGYLGPKENCFLTTGAAKVLDTEPELLEQIRLIHNLPLELGYVQRLGDYWWSSYITYAGIYTWPMMNCGLLMHHFSGRAMSVQRQLQRFHKGIITVEAVLNSKEIT